ncbi:TFP11-domain-containing protein [Balamuthia mandrillaris]
MEGLQELLKKSGQQQHQEEEGEEREALLQAQQELLEVIQLTAELLQAAEEKEAEEEEEEKRKRTSVDVPDMFADGEDELWEVLPIRNDPPTNTQTIDTTKKEVEEENSKNNCRAVCPKDRRWHDARLCYKTEGGTFMVRFSSFGGLEAEVRAEDILFKGVTLKHSQVREALFDSSSLSSSSSSSSSTTKHQSKEVSEHKDIAYWEKHTTGFASRMLAKMGYKKGAGLGKQGEGIARPLGLSLAAPSMKQQLLGLGHEDRKRGRLEEDGEEEDAGEEQRRKKRKKEKLRNKQKYEAAKRREKEAERENVFGILNKTLMSESESEQQKQKRREEEERRLKKMKEEELEEGIERRKKAMTELELRLERLQESLQRNRGRDPKLASSIKRQIHKLEAQKAQLESNTKHLSTRLKIKADRKKMVVF